MKKIFFTIISALVLLVCSCYHQEPRLKEKVSNNRNDIYIELNNSLDENAGNVLLTIDSLLINSISIPKIQLAKLYLVKGKANSIYGLYSEALECFNKSEKLLFSNPDSLLLTELFYQKGLLYYNQNLLNSALKCYDRSLKISSMINDTTGMVKSCFSIGKTFWSTLRKEKMELSKAYLNEALRLETNLNSPDSTEIAKTIMELGEAYYYGGNRDSCLLLFYSAHEIFKRFNNNHGIAVSATKLAHRFRTVDPHLALEFIKIAKSKILLTEDVNYKSIVYKISSMINEEGLKDFKSAMKDYKISVFYEQKIYKQQSRKEFILLESKFKKERHYYLRKIKINNQLRLNARNNSLQYSLIAIFLILLFVVTMIFSKIRLPKLFLKGMVFIGFLIFFEFLVLLSDPLFFTTSIVYKLFYNSVIALLIFPVHGRLNNYVSKLLSA
jgi:tetratricopeptide (TPR) repeat protein